MLSRVRLFATPRTTAHQTSLSITHFQSLLKLMSIELVMPSNHLILCHPLFLLPSIFPSIRVSSNESVLSTRWPKYWSFGFSISPSNEYSGLISFRMDLVGSPCSTRDSQDSSATPLSHQGSLNSLTNKISVFSKLLYYLQCFFPLRWNFILCIYQCHASQCCLIKILNKVLLLIT